VVIRERRPVRRAGMVGATAHPAGRGGWNGAGRAGSRLGWIAELERLRAALTEDEFESAKRHLLAG
jgi:hypothetical protein